jgi:small GTP-binding protein
MDVPKVSLALVGDANVGKTSFVQRIVSQRWDVKVHSTIGVDFQSVVVRFEPPDATEGELVQTQQVKFMIWDTAGQERYAQIILSHFRNKQYIAILYAIDDRESFESVERWFDTASTYASPNTKYILIGVKADRKRRVTTKEGAEMAQRFNCMFFETSSRKLVENYHTPLEIMKELAQDHWETLRIKELQYEHDVMATRAGYITGTFPDGILPVELQEPPRKKGCSC